MGLTVVSLSRLTPGLSGVYTCKVSTNTQETVSRARLQILRKPKKPSIFISSETPDRLEVTCSEEEEEKEGSSEQSLTLYIDGSAVATAREGRRVVGLLYKYYLQYRDSFTAECRVSLRHINFTTTARQTFPANYSS